MSYVEVFGTNKDTNSTKIESTTTETPNITQTEGVVELGAIRSVLLMEENCSCAKFNTFPTARDSDSSVVSNSSNSSIH